MPAHIRTSLARTSLTRGMVGLLLAPLLASPAVILLLALPDGLSHLSPDDFFSLGPVRGLLWPTLMFGLPTWGLLRLVRRESALAYGLAGAAEALAVALWVGYAFTGGVRADQGTTIAIATATGALIALLFWIIARPPS